MEKDFGRCTAGGDRTQPSGARRRFETLTSSLVMFKIMFNVFVDLFFTKSERNS
jgi:hypothetical protein